MKNLVAADAIDALLPQTQCRLCEFEGCRPYAEAIAAGKAQINRCPPGGVDTLVALANLLSQDPSPFIAELTEKAKPDKVVHIREEACIGCTKCIQACPTDAIIGMAKKMHTVITDACSGCELCIAPCPVDCIDVLILPPRSSEEKKQAAQGWRQRHQQNQRRQLTKAQQHAQTGEIPPPSVDQRKAAINAALLRVAAKKREL